MPKKITRALTATLVKTATDGVHYDGNGLELRVRGKARSWVLRQTVDGKRINTGLGSADKITLADARKQARAIRSGKGGTRTSTKLDNPEPERKPEPAPTPKAVPWFEELAFDYWAANRARWREEYALSWWNLLRLHAFPTIGEKSVDNITTADLGAMLEPIWLTKHPTARLVRERVAVVMDRAVGLDYIANNPCHRLDYLLKKVKHQQTHRDSLPYEEVAGAIAAVKGSRFNHMGKLAFEFMILTACRLQEACGARWSEIDLENRVWTVPADRMKAGREHRIPLSDRAMEILNETSGKGLVFPSPQTGKPLNSSGFQKLMKSLSLDCSPHGYRTSFAVWAVENEWGVTLTDLALSHPVGNRVTRAYVRTDALEQRRPMMQAWNDYLNGGN